MPQFAANLSWMYTEHAFLDRFEAAAADGFRGVEFLFPYEFSEHDIAQRLRAHGLNLVLFNLPAGNWAAKERGMACQPGKQAQFRQSVLQAQAYAKALQCPRLHAMAGILPQGVSHDEARNVYIENLRWAAKTLAPDGITLLIEPINGQDMPGYFLQHQEAAHEIVCAVGQPNLKIQMDFYHCHIMQGDVLGHFERHASGIAHVQIAGAPGRGEPDQGEIDYPAIFARLDALGYAGWIGCEYRPRGKTSAGLGWLKSCR